MVTIPASDLFLRGPYKVTLHKTLAPPEARQAAGKAWREKLSRASLGQWEPAPTRPDPVDMIIASGEGRQQALLPIRAGRMAVNPFTFYRGTANIMANDLAPLPHFPTSSIQICGDAHLSNFGFYASRERTLMFDINDFDEATAGPWEWDLKRLATSFVLCARTNGVAGEAEAAVRGVVAGYIAGIREMASLGWLDRHYKMVKVSTDAVTSSSFDAATKAAVLKVIAKAEGHTQRWTVGRYTEVRDGEIRFISQPPVVTMVPRATEAKVTAGLRQYLPSLSLERRVYLYGYHVLDVAHKIVGVGSVGLYDYIVLLGGDGPDDHLLLQVKQAVPSVIKTALKEPARFGDAERVVVGSWLMQAISDPFLGWTSVDGRRFYVRQLKDMKGAMPTELLKGPLLTAYAALCGWTLGFAHSRTGDPHMSLGYVGKGPALSDAMWAFSRAYADQAEKDYECFMSAIKSGRVAAESA